MESLPDEMIVNICEQMDEQQLSVWIQTNKKYKDICQDLLRKKELRYYLDKLSGNDPHLQEVITFLVYQQKIDNNKFFRIHNHSFNFSNLEELYLLPYKLFQGNRARATLKMLDFIYDNFQWWGRNNDKKVNIFEDSKPDLIQVLESYKRGGYDDEDERNRDLLDDLYDSLTNKDFEFIEYETIPQIVIH